MRNKEVENIVCTKSNAFALDSKGLVHYWGLNPQEQSLSELQMRMGNAKPDLPQQFAGFGKKEVVDIACGRESFSILLSPTDAKQCIVSGRCLNSSIIAGQR